MSPSAAEGAILGLAVGKTTAGVAGVDKEVKMPAQKIFKCFQCRSSPTPVNLGAHPCCSDWVCGILCSPGQQSRHPVSPGMAPCPLCLGVLLGIEGAGGKTRL